VTSLGVVIYGCDAGLATDEGLTSSPFALTAAPKAPAPCHECEKLKDDHLGVAEASSTESLEAACDAAQALGFGDPATICESEMRPACSEARCEDTFGRRHKCRLVQPIYVEEGAHLSVDATTPVDEPVWTCRILYFITCTCGCF